MKEIPGQGSLAKRTAAGKDSTVLNQDGLGLFSLAPFIRGHTGNQLFRHKIQISLTYPERLVPHIDDMIGCESGENRRSRFF
jgi:hypothetical protein